MIKRDFFLCVVKNAKGEQIAGFDSRHVNGMAMEHADKYGTWRIPLHPDVHMLITPYTEQVSRVALLREKFTKWYIRRKLLKLLRENEHK